MSKHVTLTDEIRTNNADPLDVQSKMRYNEDKTFDHPNDIPDLQTVQAIAEATASPALPVFAAMVADTTTTDMTMPERGTVRWNAEQGVSPVSHLAVSMTDKYGTSLYSKFQEYVAGDKLYFHTGSYGQFQLWRIISYVYNEEMNPLDSWYNYEVELEVSDALTFDNEEAVNLIFSKTVDTSGLMPKSAGSSNPFTGDVYFGNNIAYALAAIARINGTQGTGTMTFANGGQSKFRIDMPDGSFSEILIDGQSGGFQFSGKSIIDGVEVEGVFNYNPVDGLKFTTDNNTFAPQFKADDLTEDYIVQWPAKSGTQVPAMISDIENSLSKNGGVVNNADQDWGEFGIKRLAVLSDFAEEESIAVNDRYLADENGVIVAEWSDVANGWVVYNSAGWSGKLVMSSLTGHRSIPFQDKDYTAVADTADLTPLTEDRVYTHKLSLTSAQILTLGTPISFGIPSPGAGKMIVPIDGFWRIRNSTVAYTGNVSLNIRHVGANISIFTASVAPLSSTGNGGTQQRVGGFVKQASVMATNQYFENVGIEVYTATGNPSTGNGDLDLYVSYKIVSL